MDERIWASKSTYKWLRFSRFKAFFPFWSAFSATFYIMCILKHLIRAQINVCGWDTLNPIYLYIESIWNTRTHARTHIIYCLNRKGEEEETNTKCFSPDDISFISHFDAFVGQFVSAYACTWNAFKINFV